MRQFRQRAISSVTLVTFALFSVTARAAAPPPVEAEHGMVVTAQHLATDVGVQVLKNGGNVT